jgi:hypothetical protein
LVWVLVLPLVWVLVVLVLPLVFPRSDAIRSWNHGHEIVMIMSMRLCHRNTCRGRADSPTVTRRCVHIICIYLLPQRVPSRVSFSSSSPSPPPTPASLPEFQPMIFAAFEALDVWLARGGAYCCVCMHMCMHACIMCM